MHYVDCCVAKDIKELAKMYKSQASERYKGKSKFKPKNIHLPQDVDQRDITVRKII